MVIVLVDVCVWGLAHLRKFFALSLVGVVDTRSLIVGLCRYVEGKYCITLHFT